MISPMVADIRSPMGFIVIYRWRVESAHEQSFKERWRDVTMEGRELGALGSCLAREENGDFVAIALWPTRQARADAFVRMNAGPAWLGAKRFDEIKLDVEDNLWVNSPFDQEQGQGKAFR
jgi:hypothetical protein